MTSYADTEERTSQYVGNVFFVHFGSLMMTLTSTASGEGESHSHAVVVVSVNINVRLHRRRGFKLVRRGDDTVIRTFKDIATQLAEFGCRWQSCAPSP